MTLPRSLTRNAVCATLAVVAASCHLPAGAAHHDDAILPLAPVCWAPPPAGPTLDRWTQTGGVDGPLGCATGSTQPAPGGRGTVTPFANGQIVTSPEQGTKMTVAVYQQGPDLYVEWGDSAPFSYDRFLVRWDFNGSNAGQEDVPMFFVPGQTTYIAPHLPRTRGIFAIPLPRAGTYSIAVEGCDYTYTGSDCKQGWTVPATITYVPLPPPSASDDCGVTLADGPIRQRWMALRGLFGPLGCPTTGPLAPPGGAAGEVVTFRHGQIGWAPAQGTNLTVAAYQAESDIVVEWGDTAPYHYAKFNVRWSKDGQFITQNEIRQPLGDAGPYNHGIDHVRGVGPGTYTVTVEGCDDGTVGSTCRQGFTFPVNVVGGALRSAAVPNCAIVPTGPIGDRWSRTNLLALGCATGPEQSVGSGKVQTFAHGQIAWSPDQGSGMTVAFYQEGNKLRLDWGDSFPFSYDKFIVRINGDQFDQTPNDGHISGSWLKYPWKDKAPDPIVNTNYTAIVEGCDVSASGSTCRQRWTIPVSVTYVDPATLPGTGIDFTQLHPSQSAADIATELPQRQLTISQFDACNKTLYDMFKDEQDFSNGAIAKLDMVSRGVRFCAAPFPARPTPQLDEVNSALRFEQILSATGSSSDDWKCPRTGEYDVALTGYITMVYRYGQLLDDDVRAHIINDLLDARGPALFGELSYCHGIEETENHLNQIESARYLTNQLLYRASGNQAFNNETNGMNDVILDRLQAFLKRDFIEYNSRPYGTYTANAIQNLFDFASDRRVRKAAQLVLDYLSAKYAVSSSSIRRASPYRRRVSEYDDDLFAHNADPWSPRMEMMTGMLNQAPPTRGPLFDTGWNVDMQMAAVSDYRAADMVVDFILDPSRRSYYERIHHFGVEIYASTPDYLISAGGYWMGGPYTFGGATTDDDDGPVLATTLMPTGSDRSVGDLIRIDGFNRSAIDTRNRLNTCVAPDFACGIALRIPRAYMNRAGCVVDRPSSSDGTRHWLFIDAASPACIDPARTGRFYVAAFIAGDPNGDNRGFFEAHSFDGLSFDDFKAGVLARNDGHAYVFDSETANAYVMTSGRTVQFKVPPPDHNKYDWTIISTGDATLDALGSDIGRWPLASGVVFSADGSGVVKFTNGGLRTSLTLDFSDVGEPKRTVTAPRLPPPPHCRPGTHDCGDGTCSRYCM